MLSLHVYELVYASCWMNSSLVLFHWLRLSGNWFQVVVQLILLLLLNARNRSKALADYRVLILMLVIHLNSP